MAENIRKRRPQLPPVNAKLTTEAKQHTNECDTPLAKTIGRTQDDIYESRLGFFQQIQDASGQTEIFEDPKHNQMLGTAIAAYNTQMAPQLQQMQAQFAQINKNLAEFGAKLDNMLKSTTATQSLLDKLDKLDARFEQLDQQLNQRLKK